MKYRPSTEGDEIVKKDYRKKIIFSLDDFDEKGHLLEVLTIPPNTRQRLHSHAVQTEVFYILEGAATITINDVDYPAGPGDAFICSPGNIHKVWNKTTEDFRLVVFKINTRKGSDSHPLREGNCHFKISRIVATGRFNSRRPFSASSPAPRQIFASARVRPDGERRRFLHIW